MWAMLPKADYQARTKALAAAFPYEEFRKEKVPAIEPAVDADYIYPPDDDLDPDCGNETYTTHVYKPLPAISTRNVKVLAFDIWGVLLVSIDPIQSHIAELST